MSESRQFVILHAAHAGRRFKIEQDPNAGFYIYVLDGERCIHDSLQDTLALAKEFAAAEFGVSQDAWDAITPAT